MIRIPDRDFERIAEHRHGLCEIDVVFREIRGVFIGIPLELHAPIVSRDAAQLPARHNGLGFSGGPEARPSASPCYPALSFRASQPANSCGPMHQSQNGDARR